jgi:hypothetical protein
MNIGLFGPVASTTVAVARRLCDVFSWKSGVGSHRKPPSLVLTCLPSRNLFAFSPEVKIPSHFIAGDAARRFLK